MKCLYLIIVFASFLLSSIQTTYASQSLTLNDACYYFFKTPYVCELIHSLLGGNPECSTGQSPFFQLCHSMHNITLIEKNQLEYPDIQDEYMPALNTYSTRQLIAIFCSCLEVLRHHNVSLHTSGTPFKRRIKDDPRYDSGVHPFVYLLSIYIHDGCDPENISIRDTLQQILTTSADTFHDELYCSIADILYIPEVVAERKLQYIMDFFNCLEDTKLSFFISNGYFRHTIKKYCAPLPDPDSQNVLIQHAIDENTKEEITIIQYIKKRHLVLNRIYRKHKYKFIQTTLGAFTSEPYENEQEAEYAHEQRLMPFIEKCISVLQSNINPRIKRFYTDCVLDCKAASTIQLIAKNNYNIDMKEFSE